MKTYDYSKVKDFIDTIKNVDDLDKLNAAQELLDSIMEINALKNRIKELESELTIGGRAMFYFFTLNLDEQEIVFASEKVQGRMKVLKKKEGDHETK
tara:strand:- start:2695 stop:2985 length:291 start_codon:yes stop_codon:yes gene_type:complete